MATDLAFSLGDHIPVAAFDAFFAARPHTTVVEDPDGQGLHALYENPDTEVSFAFGWRAGSPTFELAPGRPRPFALEAEPEIAAFAAKFAIPWSPGTLLAAWSAAKKPKGKAAAVLPAALIERVWRWNHERLALGRSLELLVPRLWVTAVKGKAKLGVDWEPDVPAALPEVDVVWVSWAGKGGERLVPFAKLAEALAPAAPGSIDAAFAFRRVGEDSPPEALLAKLDKLAKGEAPAHVAFGSLRESDALGAVSRKG